MIIDYDNLDKDSKDYFDYYLLGGMSEEQAKAYKNKRDKELAKTISYFKKLPNLCITSGELEETNRVMKNKYLDHKKEYDAIASRLKARNDKEYPIWLKRMQDKIDNN
ncbi:hypothetical protein [Levilactobacillus phage ENFP1]|nr:hypothetical protein [Levilactobacillus phage ENFP1]